MSVQSAFARAFAAMEAGKPYGKKCPNPKCDHPLTVGEVLFDECYSCRTRLSEHAEWAKDDDLPF